MINKKTKTARINKDFYNELDKIIENRYKNKSDKIKTNIRVLTGLLIKHNSWGTIRADLEKVNIERYKDE